MQDKAAGKHVNAKDIKKHRSDVLKNLVIVTEDSVEAPQAIVECVQEFVAYIRGDWAELGDALGRSLEQEADFVAALLDQLELLFVTRQ